MGDYTDVVRATKTCLETSLGKLSDIRETFIEVAKLYKEVEGTNRRYAEIIKGQLPTWGQDEEYKFPVEVDDESYFKAISKLFKRMPDEERLNTLIQLVKEIKPVLGNYRRKLGKLNTTVKSLPAMVKDENGKMVDNGERRVAMGRRQKVEATVNVLEARLADALSRFLTMRRTMLKRILGQSEMLAKLFEEDSVLVGYAPEFKESYGKLTVKPVLNDFVELERKVCGRKA